MLTRLRAAIVHRLLAQGYREHAAPCNQRLALFRRNPALVLYEHESCGEGSCAVHYGAAGIAFYCEEHTRNHPAVVNAAPGYIVLDEFNQEYAPC